MNIWFIVIVLIVTLELGMVISKHGSERTDMYNAWTQLLSALLIMFLIYKAIQTGF